MEAQRDFRELLESFNAHRVEYVIVGGYALAFHGVPRFTGDLDLYVRPTKDNAQRILGALAEFGFGQVGLSPSDFEEPGQVIQFGVAPVRIDLVTSIEGVSWEQVEHAKVVGMYGDLPAYYIGRAEFIANKKACARQKDLADLEALGEG